jgi:hypothetical protein
MILLRLAINLLAEEVEAEGASNKLPLLLHLAEEISHASIAATPSQQAVGESDDKHAHRHPLGALLNGYPAAHDDLHEFIHFSLRARLWNALPRESV